MSTIGRRRLLASGGAALAALHTVALTTPAVAASDSERVLRFMPQVDLVSLDPHYSMTNVTRNHAGLVFDQLYGTDSKQQAQPQMVEGHVMEDGGKRWTLTLREGLVFHDGQKVLARDCVASIRRWGRRDVLGVELLRISDEITATDDRTIVFRFKQPFPKLPQALGKPGAYMPAMMPERLAQTDPYKQIPEVIGSGPFRYVASERLQGVRNVYAKFDGYVPRPNGVPDRAAGPKIVHFERVVWTTMPDQGVALAALQTGEQDWWEFAAQDLLPLIRRDRETARRSAGNRGQHGIRAVQSFAAAVQPAGDAPRHLARAEPGGFHCGPGWRQSGTSARRHRVLSRLACRMRRRPGWTPCGRVTPTRRRRQRWRQPAMAARRSCRSRQATIRM